MVSAAGSVCWPAVSGLCCWFCLLAGSEWSLLLVLFVGRQWAASAAGSVCWPAVSGLCTGYHEDASESRHGCALLCESPRWILFCCVRTCILIALLCSKCYSPLTVNLICAVKMHQVLMHLHYKVNCNVKDKST